MTNETENKSEKQEIKQKKPWWHHAIELLVIIAIGYGILLWQDRHLLKQSDDAMTPQQVLVGLDEKAYAIPVSEQKQLIYFFAPWCTICHLSIGNIESQKQALLDKGYQVRYVALDWQSKAEVQEFATNKKLTFPVLMGTKETMNDYKVQGFPTYYLIDEKGKIITGSQGYSSSLGVWLRSLNN